jgi:hypothetical protein
MAISQCDHVKRRKMKGQLKLATSLCAHVKRDTIKGSLLLSTQHLTARSWCSEVQLALHLNEGSCRELSLEQPKHRHAELTRVLTYELQTCESSDYHPCQHRSSLQQQSNNIRCINPVDCSNQGNLSGLHDKHICRLPPSSTKPTISNLR